PTATLRGHILLQRTDRFASEDLIADGRLDRHFEHLTRNILLHLLSYLSASERRFIAVDNKRQGIHALAVQQDIDFHQLGWLVADDLIVERCIALCLGLQSVIEVEHDLAERHLVNKHDPGRIQIGQTLLRAAALLAQGQEVADIGLRRDERRLNVRLLEVLDRGGLRQLCRVINVQGLAFGGSDLVHHRRRRTDQLQRKLALKALLDDLHMKKAQEATAKAESEGDRGLRLIDKAGLVKAD